MNRGINFKNYYILFINLSEGKTEGYKKSEYRKKIFELLANDLEKNFLYGHIYAEDIEQVQRNDYFAKLKVGYYPIMSNDKQYINISFFHDCIQLNGLYITY